MDSPSIPNRIGEAVTFVAHGRMFTVKRLSRDTWNLRDHAITERSRFGNRKEIAQDIAAVLESGALPRSACPRTF